MRNTQGFTLVELMITVVLAGVILAIAVPAMSNLVRSNRSTAQANEVVAAFQYARSEAVKRGQAVSLCQSSDQTSCTGGTDWDAGWMIFTDPAENASFDAANDTRLRVHQGLDGSALDATSGGDSITYLASGRVDATMDLQLDPERCEQQQRREITITLTGSPRTQRDSC